MIKFSVSRVEKEAVFLEGNEPPSFWALPENDTYTPVRSVSYELTVKSAAGSIIVTGQVSGSVSATCGRCLAPLEMEISNSSIELSLDELAECSEACGWADVCKDWQTNS